eukprot:UN01299
MAIKRRGGSSVAPSRAPAPAPTRAPAPAPTRAPPAAAPMSQPSTNNGLSPQSRAPAPVPHQQQPMMQQQPHHQQQPMMQQQPHHQPMMQQPMQQPMMQQPQQQGGGLMSSIAGGIMNGMTFGVGSAVANRAVDAIMGPRTVQHEYVNKPGDAAAPAAAPAAPEPQAQPQFNNYQAQPQTMRDCTPFSTNYANCMSANGSNPNACVDFMTSLQQCQTGSH